MISSAEAMRSGLPKSASHGCTKPGMRKLDTEKPVRPAFGLAPEAGGALVADLPARTGRRAREGRDGGGMVMCFDLHQDVDRLDQAVVAMRRRIREEARRTRPLDHRRVVAIGGQYAGGIGVVGGADHREKRHAALGAVDR